MSDSIVGPTREPAELPDQLDDETFSPDDPAPLAADPRISKAKQRYLRCVEWEGPSRERFLDDLRFANGDSDNGFQWPGSIRRARERRDKPCLTMNVIRQHNLQIINEGKINKSSMTVLPVGNGATLEAAGVYKQLLNRIEYQSNAQLVYSIAREFQVKSGWGYWRITTDYVDEDGFDQEAFLRAINDPLTVYLDPDSRLPHGGDANFGFVFDRVAKDRFREEYPDFEGPLDVAALGEGDFSWVDTDYVQICEYYERIPVVREILSIEHPEDGRRVTVRREHLPPEVLSEVLQHPKTRRRRVKDWRVRWTLFVGEEIADETDWPGSHIPLIRVIGEESIVDGTLDRKGHTRAMKDAQRMFNYNASASVEFGALQTKAPYIAPAKSIEGLTQYWATANIEDHSVLPFNHLDDDGQPIPPPQRTQPPTSSPAFESGMQTAFNQMMMVSGQWQNQMGMMGNERTGEAIGKRQEQGDVATFHFRDNFDEALAWSSKQIIELIPQIYDTKRVVRILADDGTEREVEIDPAARQAYLEDQSHDQELAKRVLNPTIGRYDVRAASGRTYGSRREETVQALTLILTQAPALTGIIGDLLLKAMDFEEANEAAQRLHRMVPPQALGQGPSPQEQQLAAQVQALQAALQKALGVSAKDQLKLVGKDQMREIDAYKAETDRIKALGPEVQPGELESVIQQLVQDALQTHLQTVSRGAQSQIADTTGAGADPEEGEAPPQAPHPGAQQAPDGQWYLPDPSRQGQYLRLEPGGTA